MKDIRPYYAVKCNPNFRIVNQLSNLGCNFDCASPKEIDLVLSTGCEPSRIIYANPCKKESDIKYAIKNGVFLTTFDSICELEKIAKNPFSSKMKLILIQEKLVKQL
jgi:ornithine decarboxylase